MLKINPKIRSEEQAGFLKAFMQEKNTLEILIKNKTQEIDQNSILDCFSKYMEIQTAHKNEVLFHMGDNADKFYIILKGAVEIFRQEKRKILLSRFEYYKYLEKALYEEEIGIVKQILNSNYEKISFENYDDFYEFSKAKAKISLIEKFKSITDKNSLEDFYQQNSIIMKIFKIAYSLNDINSYSDQIYDLTLSEKKKYNISEKDEFNSESDDNNEEESQFEVNNLKSEQNQEDSNDLHKYSQNNFLVENTNKKFKMIKNKKHMNLDIHELISLKEEIFYKKNDNNSNSGIQIKNKNEEKEISKLKNLNSSRKKTNESICQKFELNIKEQEILKKYFLMNNESLKFEYKIILIKPLFVGENGYFGDFELEDQNKIRKATVKCCENNTLLGFITKEVYNENIFSRNQKNIFKNIQMLNDISFFKNISFANFQSFCYDKFELRKFFKNETLIESNNQLSEILILKEGKADVTLNANIFDIMNIIEEILESFPINNNSLTPEDLQLIKNLKNKKIYKNNFNQKQKDNLMIRKNLNLFSVERSGILGLEPCFLKMKSFYKIIPVTERVSVYALSEENFDAIFTQYSECSISYEKLAHKKCIFILKRLNEIQNSILSLSNLKFNNFHINNHIENQQTLKKIVASSKEKIESQKISKFSTSSILPNIKIKIINEDAEENFTKYPSIEIVENINKKLINRNISNFTNISNYKYLNKENSSIEKDDIKFTKPYNKFSFSNPENKSDKNNNILLDQQSSKTLGSNFYNNFMTKKSEIDLEEYNNLRTNINHQVNFRTRLKSFNSNYSKSSSNLPFVNNSFVKAEKIQNQINSIKFERDKSFQENNIEKINQLEKEISLTDKIKGSYDCNIINKIKQIKPFESDGNKYILCTTHLKKPFINKTSDADETKKDFSKSGELCFDKSNISEKDNEESHEENLFPFNKNLDQNLNRKTIINNSSIDKYKIEDYNQKTCEEKIRLNRNSTNKKSIYNHKFSSMNEIQRVNALNSYEIFNESPTNVNMKNFNNIHDDEHCNINFYNFSNIYQYGIINSYKEKSSLNYKRMKSVDHQNINFYYTEYFNIQENGNNELNILNNNNINTVNEDKNCQHTENNKQAVFNKSIMKFKKTEKFLSEKNNLSNSNINENIVKKESLKKPLAIKIFDDVDLDFQIPKTQKFKNALINIQNLRKRIQTSNVKKIMLSKN